MTDDFVLVPREPTPEMIEAASRALAEWRASLDRDEALLRGGRFKRNGNPFLGSATEEEKHAIRYRAMIASAPKPVVKESLSTETSPSRAWTDAEVEAAARAAGNARNEIYGGDGTLWDQLPRTIRKTELHAMRAALAALTKTR